MILKILLNQSILWSCCALCRCFNRVKWSLGGNLIPVERFFAGTTWMLSVRPQETYTRQRRMQSSIWALFISPFRPFPPPILLLTLLRSKSSSLLLKFNQLEFRRCANLSCQKQVLFTAAKRSSLTNWNMSGERVGAPHPLQCNGRLRQLQSERGTLWLALDW